VRASESACVRVCVRSMAKSAPPTNKREHHPATIAPSSSTREYERGGGSSAAASKRAHTCVHISASAASTSCCPHPSAPCLAAALSRQLGKATSAPSASGAAAEYSITHGRRRHAGPGQQRAGVCPCAGGQSRCAHLRLCTRSLVGHHASKHTSQSSIRP